MDLKLEKSYLKKGIKYIFGVDEAGRGPLAGPVVAAAVMINSNFEKQKSKLKLKTQKLKELLKILRDSKRLSFKKREEIFNLIKKMSEIKYAYASVNEKIIDKINIEQATFLAMRKSIEKLKNKLKISPQIILVDGNQKISKLKYPQKTIIKGDAKVSSIAISSIIAKVIRDKKMEKLSKKYPQYKFEIHKGYPTKLHLKLLKNYGPSKIHRKSYKPVKLIIQKSTCKITEKN
ncbi:MAG: ribonuclease HII [Minisyncoccia bacterium]